MNAYETDIRAIDTLGMADIIRIAKDHTPFGFRTRPWAHIELKHGKGILTSEAALNCYLSAYGPMHVHKMKHVLENGDLHGLEKGFEVVDWGCGQGLASICLIEHPMEQGTPMPSRISLVDASPAALDRAELHLGVQRKDAWNCAGWLHTCRTCSETTTGRQTLSPRASPWSYTCSPTSSTCPE